MTSEPASCSCGLDASKPTSVSACMGPVWSLVHTGLQTMSPEPALSQTCHEIHVLLSMCLCVRTNEPRRTGQFQWEDNRISVLVPKHLVKGLSGEGKPITDKCLSGGHLHQLSACPRPAARPSSGLKFNAKVCLDCLLSGYHLVFSAA